ncbi:MAG: metallophosphoesterase [Clostridiaceae bacterium]|nr:metallophosphoesterase [Clostridiaceae bacterium]
MKAIRFAVFSDLHYDFVHDANRRIIEFARDAKEKNVDFIIGLGDLCYPIDKNRNVLNTLKSTGVPCYFAIGNHDSDTICRDSIVHFLGIKNNYYSFERGNIKFIVLDSCFIKKQDGYEAYFKKNYNKSKDSYPYIPPFELEWLKNELKSTHKYYVIFSHHSLVNDFAKRGICNREEVRKILEQSREKILFCMNGHDHGDKIEKKNGITYFTLNSMSYIWQGMKENNTYSNEILAKYLYMKDFILYEEPLHAIVTIKEDGRVEIDGMKGHYQTLRPEEIGMSDSWNGVTIKPVVSSLIIE